MSGAIGVVSTQPRPGNAVGVECLENAIQPTGTKAFDPQTESVFRGAVLIFSPEGTAAAYSVCSLCLFEPYGQACYRFTPD